jgi:hypothetical protein
VKSLPATIAVAAVIAAIYTQPCCPCDCFIRNRPPYVSIEPPLLRRPCTGNARWQGTLPSHEHISNCRCFMLYMLYMCSWRRFAM